MSSLHLMVKINSPAVESRWYSAVSNVNFFHDFTPSLCFDM
ncbi:hypothetical protein HMPREF1870_01024 [Bacteroidales bacterium KA00344]|nr:hypothetical protein HMPREF1870_01024 [Bacteroidales bacterium KA00344]